MITREARAVWSGSIEEGSGTLRSRSLEHPYSLAMALSLGLGEAGHDPESVDARAAVSLDPDALANTTIELEVEGRVPGMDEGDFGAEAREAKEHCPVSRALAGVDIVLAAVRLARGG